MTRDQFIQHAAIALAKTPAEPEGGRLIDQRPLANAIDGAIALADRLQQHGAGEVQS